MKGIIIAAGPGEALKPITTAIPKPMIPIVGKPLIQYAIERLHLNGIRDIFIVIKKGQTAIPDYFENGEHLGVTINYIEQMHPGLDGSILSIKSSIREKEKFILSHCAIIADHKLLTRTLNAVDNAGADMGMAIALQSEVQDFGLVNLDDDGYISEIIPDGEKGEGHYVVAGTFILTSKIFEYLESGIAFNQCFNQMIQEGFRIAAGIWTEDWVDVGYPWDILRASTFLLSSLTKSIISKDVNIEHNVEIKGPVVIESGVEILNGSIIKGPVFLGKNAYVGNNTLIRDCAVIESYAKIGMGVEIKNSVVMEGASIARLSYVGSSIIGPKSTLHAGAMTINSTRPSKPIMATIGGQEVLIPLEKFGAVVGPNSHVGEHSSLSPGTFVDEDTIIGPNQAINGRAPKG